MQRREDRGVVTLVLNRPDQANALSEAMLCALQEHLDSLEFDPAVRCIVLAAAGEAFCAGHDLREMDGTPKLEWYENLFMRCSRVMQTIQSLPVPVIARVHGIATAAGCQLVASCDLAIAARSARFAVSGINVGLFCATPAVALSRNVSTKHAFEMLISGHFIEADQAADWGLVNEVVNDEKLDESVARMADTIRAKSPTAVRHGKRMFYRQREMELSQAYAFAASVMAENMMAEDARDGISAFLEKRRPARPSNT